MEWVKYPDVKPLQRQRVLIAGMLFGAPLVTAAEYYVGYIGDSFPWNPLGISGQEWEWDIDGGIVTHWTPLPKHPLEEPHA